MASVPPSRLDDCSDPVARRLVEPSEPVDLRQLTERRDRVRSSSRYNAIVGAVIDSS
jgi:hypothetical protein